MMKIILLLSFLFVTEKIVNAQQFFSNNSYGKNRNTEDHLGVFTSLGVNASGGSIQGEAGYARSAKGALSTVPMIGAFYQKGITEQLSVRLSVAFGTNSYAYKYAGKFDSMRSDNIPTTTKKFKNYTRVKNSSNFILPQLDIGYALPPIKEMYLIEVRGGIGLHAYLSPSDDSIRVSPKASVSYANSSNRLNYFTTEHAEYGKPDLYGSFVATIYAGLRWQKTTSSFLNRSGLGILTTIPINTDKSGFSEIRYLGADYDYLIGSERIKMALLSFSVRYSYNIL